MKEFNNPEIEIVLFESSDVVLTGTSGDQEIDISDIIEDEE